MTTDVIEYKKALLVQHDKGVDIIDPLTSRWTTVRNMRSAKWNLSVWLRLNKAFVLE